MGYFFHFASVALMALSPLLNKWALVKLSPFEAAFFNAGIAAFVGMIASFFSSRGDWALAIRSKSNVAAGICNGIGLLCLFRALELADPLTVGMIGRLYIPMSVMLGLIFLREYSTRMTKALLLLSLLGMFAFVWKPLAGPSLAAVSFAVLFAFAFALTNFLGKKTKTSATVTASFNNLVATVILFPIYLTQRDAGGIDFISLPFLCCAVSAILGGWLGLSLFFKGLKTVSLLESNLIRSLSPLLVAVYSLPFFKLSLSPLNICGGILLISSCLGFTLEKIWQGRQKKIKMQETVGFAPTLILHARR